MSHPYAVGNQPLSVSFNPPLVMPEAGFYMFTIGNGVLAVHGPGNGVNDRGDLVATYHLGDDGWHLVVEVPEHPGDPQG